MAPPPSGEHTQSPIRTRRIPILGYMLECPTHEPCVGVGVPVRNASQTLDLALDAIVRQTHRNLDILISDNCSEDDTEAIARSWCERDSRIRYVRQGRPLSALRHFEYVFKQLRRPFFLWAAHDDLRNDEYVSATLEALSRHPGASLAFGQLINFDDYSKALDGEPVPYTFVNAGLGYNERLKQVLTWGCGELYGLIRTSALDDYTWFDTDYASDAPIVVHLAMKGDFVYAPEARFYQYVAPEPPSPKSRAVTDSHTTLRPFRWLRLAWTSARAAVLASEAAGRRHPGTVRSFLRVYARVRPVKAASAVYGRLPGPARRAVRRLRSRLRTFAA